MHATLERHSSILPFAGGRLAQTMPTNQRKDIRERLNRNLDRLDAEQLETLAVLTSEMLRANGE